MVCSHVQPIRVQMALLAVLVDECYSPCKCGAFFVASVGQHSPEVCSSGLDSVQICLHEILAGA